MCFLYQTIGSSKITRAGRMNLRFTRKHSEYGQTSWKPKSHVSLGWNMFHFTDHYCFAANYPKKATEGYFSYWTFWNDCISVITEKRSDGVRWCKSGCRIILPADLLRDCLAKLHLVRFFLPVSLVVRRLCVWSEQWNSGNFSSSASLKKNNSNVNTVNVYTQSAAEMLNQSWLPSIPPCFVLVFFHCF